MKKILVLSNAIGGLYNFRRELIQELVVRKYRVYIASPQGNKISYFIELGCIYNETLFNRRGMNPIQELNLIENYEEIIKEITPDLILTYTIKPNIYGNYIADKYNIPVIMNITGLGTSLTTGKLKGIIKKMYKYACIKSKYVFFQNQDNHEFFISNNLVDINKTKIISGSGVNLQIYKPIEKTNKDEIIRFIYIGRLMRDKGIEEYLKSADNITKQYSNVEFQILGSFEEERYKDIIKKNNNPHIKYLGRSNDVRQEIKEVDCIVNPSYHEGMSNALLEGAAMGKPLIASNIPGCKEIIDDKENGYLFKVKSVEDLEDKLIQFIGLKEETRLAMGTHSRKKVEKQFDRNIVVNEYMNAIHGILNDR